MAQNVPFQTIVDTLLDDSKPFPARHLHRFSDLEPADLKTLLLAWPRIALRRKLNLLEDLEDLADADTLMSFENLARAIITDTEAPIRAQAVRLLLEFPDEKLASLYIEFLNEDESQEVRAAAATTLGQFVYLGELDEIPTALLRKVEDQLLLAAHTAESNIVRRRALESLGYSGRQEVNALIDEAYHNADPEWLASALFAMGRSSDPRWSKQVVSKLLAQNEKVRLEAVRAAGELSLKSARAPLLDLIEDEEEPEIRQQIVWALSKIGGEGVRARIEELLDVEPDDEETEFLENALDNLTFTEDLSHFDMFDFDTDEEAAEEE